jgi:hypothetical protein
VLRRPEELLSTEHEMAPERAEKMTRLTRATLLLALVGMIGVASATATRVPPGTFDGCPSAITALSQPASSYAPVVSREVLRFIRTTRFRLMSSSRARQAGAQVTSVFLVRTWLPSGWVKSECGKLVWRNSVGVTVYFPLLNLPHNPVGRCDACDHVIVLTSNTRRGWTVWGSY